MLCWDDFNDPNTGCNKIFGHIYLPIGQNKYRDIKFGPIGEDGGYPEVISVFFGNTDNDKFKELIVLCKYSQRHKDYEGDLYESYIYDNPSEKDTLRYFKELSESFWGCDCGYSDGRTEVAKYKTAQSIKIKLKEMGF